MVTAVVFSGGPRGAPGPASAVLAGLRPQVVIAADSGLELARTLGWNTDVVVGDMDSVDPTVLADAEQDGAEVVRHPTDKDATDLELALEAAAAHGTSRVVVVGSPAGRMDHLLGGALVLASPRFQGMQLEAWFGGSLVLPVHDRRALTGTPGSLVSILAVGGAADGVTTHGLRWPLRGERLEPGSTRGISNELVDGHAEVEVTRGALLVLLPEAPPHEEPPDQEPPHEEPPDEAPPTPTTRTLANKEAP